MKMLKSKKKINICMLIIMGIILYIIPYLTTGIINNDELYQRLLSMSGPIEFAKKIFEECVFDKGRAISSIVLPLTIITEFIGKSTYSFKMIQCIIIFSNCILFSKLVCKITSKRELGRIVCKRYNPSTLTN